MSPKTVWTIDPILITALSCYLLIYLWRWIQVRRTHGKRSANFWRLVAWVGGVTALFIALVSPIDSYGEDLASMHMVQHLLLLDVAPILLIVGLTKVIMRPVAKTMLELERRAGLLASPAFAVALYSGIMIFWHIPKFYNLAVTHPTWHVVEHVTFVSSGMLYWWHLLSPIRSRFRFGGTAPVIYMLTTKLLLGLLGVVLTFSPVVLYDYYEQLPRYWGLTALTDQNVAGLIMALEQSLVMGLALAVLFTKMLRDSEDDQARSERYGS